MKIVEIWTVGGKDSQSFVLLEPYLNDEYHVINGRYLLIPNKEKSEVTLIGSPLSSEKQESHYLGDVELLDDALGGITKGYDLTIKAYRETKNIVGINTVKKIVEGESLKNDDDEIPF